jgi:hypothetical protein
MVSIWTAFSDHAHAAVDWAERHAGLGGWVGAVGSIIAIFVTWLLSRREYLRTVRQQGALKRAEIDLILRMVSDFEKLFQRYVGFVVAGRPEAINFNAQHSNDAEYHAMIDLAHLPVVAWPSFRAFANFKRYWSRSLRVLETSQSQPINTEFFRIRLREHDEALSGLMTALEAVKII